MTNLKESASNSVPNRTDEGVKGAMQNSTCNVLGKSRSGVKRQAMQQLWTKIKQNRMSYVLLAPFLIFFTIFTVVPVISSVFLSFTYFNMLQPPEFVGFLNYERMFLEDKIFLTVLKNTLLFAFITGPISYILSFGFAWLINELGRRLRAFMTLVFYGPVLAGNVYFVWVFLFSGDAYGLINGFLLSLGIIQEPVQWLSDPRTIMWVLIIVQLWLSLGSGFLAFIAGFQSLDRNLYEAGNIDGIRNRWMELWFITIPQMAPQLLFGAVMQIGVSFGVSYIVMALAGFPTTQYSADTIVTYITDIGTVRFEMGYASAIAVFLFAIMLLTNKVITSALRKYSAD